MHAIIMMHMMHDNHNQHMELLEILMSSASLMMTIFQQMSVRRAITVTSGQR